MTKQLVYIFGNIGSGKSTLIKHLKPDLESFTVFQKDILRDGTMAKEHSIKVELIRTLQTKNKIVLESTGGGKFEPIIQREIRKQGFKVFSILVDCKPFECIKRFKNRLKSVQMGYNTTKICLPRLVWDIAEGLEVKKYDLRLNSEINTPKEMSEISQIEIKKFYE